ncbi:MAG: S-layer homology domain-containing protein [Clostridia bacterium]|nr:S-layer homology domain-containing protein [Clostridia bacterium]
MKKTSAAIAVILILNTLLPNDVYAGEVLPARYDSRDFGYVTPVKNQVYSCCWAHAIISCLETYMIKNGLEDPATGLPANETLNLSESHLAWFTYSDAHDKKGMLEGDKTILSDTDNFNNIYLNLGANFWAGASTLMRREGPAAETEEDLKYENVYRHLSGIDEKYAYDYNAAHLTDAIGISSSDMTEIKKKIMEHGSAYTYFYHRDEYQNENGAYCCLNFVDNKTPVAHAAAIVGWDDNYSRFNFKEDNRPLHDGAWIAKNSYGADKGDNGYVYISYEDAYIKDSEFAFFALEPTDKNKNIYQYNGISVQNGYHAFYKSGAQIANVFTADGYEELTAVSTKTIMNGVPYELSIYTGLSDKCDPVSGQLVYKESGAIQYRGYHTLPLTNPVPVMPGLPFSVVFKFDIPEDNTAVSVPCVYSYTSGTVEWIHKPRLHTSFYRENESENWFEERDGEANFCISAYSNDIYAMRKPSTAIISGQSKPLTLSECDDNIKSVFLISGELPPGTYLGYNNKKLYLSGTPQNSGDFKGTAAVKTDGTTSLFIDFTVSVITPEPTVSEVSETVYLQQGDYFTLPLCDETDGQWLSLSSESGTTPYGLELQWDDNNKPVLAGVPLREEITSSIYKIVFKDNSVKYRTIDFVVYSPEHSFLTFKNPFKDISQSDSFYTAVLWAYYHSPQIAFGAETDVFLPQESVTRGQAVSFLWRAAGCPSPMSYENTFSDVLYSAYYRDAVTWASEQGITCGISDTLFAPDMTLSQKHMITFLYRATHPGENGWIGEAEQWALDGSIAETYIFSSADGTPCKRFEVLLWMFKALK